MSDEKKLSEPPPSDVSPYLRETFGKDGHLAKLFPGYRPRKGQIELTKLIDRGMLEGKHVLAEAPTGLGKSLSYLVPAIYSGKRTVVATETIALQEQLFEKDIPTLQRALPKPFTAALIKGKNNYVCLREIPNGEAQMLYKMFETEHQNGQAQAIAQWAAKTQTGDVSELPFVPELKVWSAFSVSSDECSGRRCPHYEQCFATRALKKAKEADIIVTNFHMLFAHLTVSEAIGKKDALLPAFDQVILDEFHGVPEVARGFFGDSVSVFTVKKVAQEASKLPATRPLSDRLKLLADEFFDRVQQIKRSPNYSVRLRPEKPEVSTFKHERLCEQLRAVAREVAGVDPDALPERDKGAYYYVDANAESLAQRIKRLVEGTDESAVRWIEEDAKGRCKLSSVPLDVSDTLRELLFEEFPVTMVSATLTTGGSFDFIRKEAGVPKEDTLELVAETPFNFRKQALLVVPDGMVEPNSPSFPGLAARVTRRVIELCDGRTLGLFTSYRNLNAVHEKMQGLRYRVLKQGELPRTELVRQFKLDVHSVLLGTSSFWTGVDVSGEALTGLVIDKMPFPSPDDPLVDAICEKDRGAFGNYMMPRAIITLRQGVGRLIRSVDDVGVIVILDERLLTKGYGKKFLASLPRMTLTRDVEQISTFLREAKDGEL